MNELSWLIYLGDVTGDVNAVCSFVFYGGAIGLSVYAVGKGIAHFMNHGFNEDPVSPSIAKVAKMLWMPVVMAMVVGVVAPSKDAVYAIAASEMGERVLKSEIGGKAVEALDAWLDRQIAGSPK